MMGFIVKIIAKFISIWYWIIRFLIVSNIVVRVALSIISNDTLLCDKGAQFWKFLPFPPIKIMWPFLLIFLLNLRVWVLEPGGIYIFITSLATVDTLIWGVAKRYKRNGPIIFMCRSLQTQGELLDIHLTRRISTFGNTH